MVPETARRSAVVDADPLAGDPSLPITGERTVPGIEHENYWFRRHEAAYAWAIAQLHLPLGEAVLDAGGGEGYGSAMLAAAGARPTCLDYDQTAAAHVRSRYGVPSVRANLVALPIRDHGYTAVVSMQVVEHLWDQPAYLRECARVLLPGCALVLSTPNRLTFSPDWVPGTPPVNIFHTRELAPADLTELLRADFASVQVFGVHHGPHLADLDAQFGGLVAAQLAAGPSDWPVELTSAVAGVRADDFVICADGSDYRLEQSLDLLAVAGKAAPAG